MNVLFLCHRLPFPPSDGSRVRAFHMIKHLARDHRVTVATLARSLKELAGGEELALHCHRCLIEPIGPVAALWRMVARLPSAIPSSMGYFFSPQLAARIGDETARQRFDLIVVHCSSMAQYVGDVAGVPKIIDFADMDSQKWLAYSGFKRWPWSAGYRLEGSKLARAEAAIAAKFDLCTCITPAELATLRGFGVATPSGWFPNGVDLDFFTPGDDAHDPAALCFIGRMDYFPNQQAMLEFCREVLPRLRSQRPNVTLTIIGAEPPPGIVALGKLPGVTVTGTVPDVRPYARRAMASIAPLRIARGTQNKILEAMAMGLPVVCSSRAAAGVEASAGEHLLVADDAQAQTATLLRLIEDEGLRARLASAGRARVEARYSWTAAMAQFDDLVMSCLPHAADRAAGRSGGPAAAPHATAKPCA